MTLLPFTSTRPTSAVPPPRLVSSMLSAAFNAVGALIRAPLDFYRARREISMLAGLDEHQLRDIGLTRFDVANAASLSRDPTRALADVVAERRSLRTRR